MRGVSWWGTTVTFSRLDLGVHSKVYLVGMALNVSQVARQSGISADAVRFYEREGLLPAPSRSRAGYREYDPSIAHRIRFIKGAQAMGLRLAEIKDLLEIQDRGACPCGHTRTLVQRRIGEIDAEMERLTALRGQLSAMAELDCPATEDSELWACEVRFIEKGKEVGDGDPLRLRS
jgi:DNA-binding transcriptional MerR regulator